MEESVILEPLAVPGSRNDKAPRWPLAQRVLFRFAFIYFVLIRCQKADGSIS